MASAVIDGLLSTIAIVVAALFFWGCLIVAFIGRGYERAFATGFCLSFGLYCGILLMLGAGEFDPAAGQLPTSRVALPVFNAIVKRQYTDATFGTILPDYDPSVPETINGMPLVRSVSTAESPTRMHFMTIVHLFWAIAMAIPEPSLQSPGVAKTTLNVRNRRDEQSVEPEPRAARFLRSSLVSRGPVNHVVREHQTSWN